jgi:hypothetical protein
MEPVKFFGLGLNGSLLEVWRWRPVESDCAKGLLKEADDSPRSLQVRLIDLIRDQH